MVDPALSHRESHREEVSKNLQTLGFNAEQARGLARAMADTVSGLDLPTRSEWQQAERRHEERYAELKALIVQSENRAGERIGQLDKRMDQSESRSKERDTELRKLIVQSENRAGGRMGQLDRRMDQSESRARERYEALMQHIVQSESRDKERYAALMQHIVQFENRAGERMGQSDKRMDRIESRIEGLASSSDRRHRILIGALGAGVACIGLLMALFRFLG